MSRVKHRQISRDLSIHNRHSAAPRAPLTGFAQIGAQADPSRTCGLPSRGLAPSPERQTMTRMFLALSLGLAGMGFAAQAVQSQTQPQTQTQNCGQRPMVVEMLTGKYGETRRGMGMAANNTVMEIYASTETGTWTITITLPDGMTCLVGSGQGFEPMAEELPAKGDPA